VLRRLCFVVVAMLACNEQKVDVDRAQRAVDDAQKQVEDGLKTAQERVEAVEQDLGKAAEQVQTKVEDVTKDAIPASSDEEVAELAREAKTAIECDEESCTIQRSVADKLREKPATFASQAKVDPEKRDGSVVGLRLSEVKELPQALGFRDRDVIVSINGLRVQSVQSIPQIVLQLRGANRFTVEYERAGVRATKTIAIV
jgi:type II secretion system protein C